MKELQAKRKEIRAQQEKELAEQKREEEERVRREEAEKKAKEAEEKRRRLEEAEKKRQTMVQSQREKMDGYGSYDKGKMLGVKYLLSGKQRRHLLFLAFKPAGCEERKNQD